MFILQRLRKRPGYVDRWQTLWIVNIKDFIFFKSLPILFISKNVLVHCNFLHVSPHFMNSSRINKVVIHIHLVQSCVNLGKLLLTLHQMAIILTHMISLSTSCLMWQAVFSPELSIPIIILPVPGNEEVLVTSFYLLHSELHKSQSQLPNIA